MENGYKYSLVDDPYGTLYADNIKLKKLIDYEVGFNSHLAELSAISFIRIIIEI